MSKLASYSCLKLNDDKVFLAPNGYIYFFGINERAYVRLTPQADPDADPITATQWEVFKYNQTTPQIDFTVEGTTSASGSLFVS